MLLEMYIHDIHNLHVNIGLCNYKNVLTFSYSKHCKVMYFLFSKAETNDLNKTVVGTNINSL